MLYLLVTRSLCKEDQSIKYIYLIFLLFTLMFIFLWGSMLSVWASVENRMGEDEGGLRCSDCPQGCRGAEEVGARGQGGRRGSRRPPGPCHRALGVDDLRKGPCPRCFLCSQTWQSCRCTYWRPAPGWPPLPPAARALGRWQRGQSQGKTPLEDSGSPSNELHLEIMNNVLSNIMKY